MNKWLSPKFILILTLALIPSITHAKKEEWTDPLGKKFKGEPSGLLGPLAVFRTGRTTLQRFPLHFLSDADCVRFAKQLGNKSERAKDWEQSRGRVALDIQEHVMRVEGEKLVPATLKGLIEPEFYVVFYASNGVGASWGMMGSAIWRFQEIQKQYPTMVEGVFFGLKHSRAEHLNMAISSKLPWLVTDYESQPGMDVLASFGPEEAPRMVVITRDGAPFFSTDESQPEKINAVFDQLVELLKLMQPDDPRGWSDRVHYLKAVQLDTYRTGESSPVLVGNPLRAESLSKFEVRRFAATLQVNKDGVVTATTIRPGFDMPDKMVGPLSEALTKAVLVPAVKDGQFVDGSYEYQFPASQ